VLQGLQPGQRIVASGQFLLDSDANLKGIEAATAQDSQPNAGPALHEADGRVVQIDGTQLTVAHRSFITLGMPGMTMTFLWLISLSLMASRSVRRFAWHTRTRRGHGS
jgi:Cu(I)/Ag(I) efflux system membrane fusion protein